MFRAVSETQSWRWWSWQTAAASTRAPQGIAVSINGGTTRPVPWVEGMTFRVGSNFLTFRGGDLHLSGSSAYTVLKRQ